MSKLSVNVQGQRIPIRDFYLKKSLEEIAHSFSFSLGPGGVNTPRHQKVVIDLDSQTLCTGRIDRLERRLKEGAFHQQVSGRSLARDLIDSTATFHYQGQYLNWIFSQLCGIFNIPFHKDALTNQIKEFACTDESPWQKMAGEALNQDLLILSTPDGGITLQRGPKGTLPLTLEEGKNFASLEEEQDATAQFSHYWLNTADGLSHLERDNTLPEGVYRSIAINLGRLAYQGELRKRARLELYQGQNTRYTLNLPGWEYKPGQVWEVNYLVAVKAQSFNLNRTLIISQVELRLDQNKRRAKLVLEEPNVYT